MFKRLELYIKYRACQTYASDAISFFKTCLQYDYYLTNKQRYTLILKICDNVSYIIELLLYAEDYALSPNDRILFDICIRRFIRLDFFESKW